MLFGLKTVHLAIFAMMETMQMVGRCQIRKPPTVLTLFSLLPISIEVVMALRAGILLQMALALLMVLMLLLKW